MLVAKESSVRHFPMVGVVLGGGCADAREIIYKGICVVFLYSRVLQHRKAGVQLDQFTDGGSVLQIRLQRHG